MKESIWCESVARSEDDFGEPELIVRLVWRRDPDESGVVGLERGGDGLERKLVLLVLDGPENDDVQAVDCSEEGRGELGREIWCEREREVESAGSRELERDEGGNERETTSGFFGGCSTS